VTTNPTHGVREGVCFAGEALVPGGANLVQGDLRQAGLHFVLGMAARAAFGLPGVLLVSANSFVKSTTGTHLYQQLGLWQRFGTAPPAAEAAQPAAGPEAG